MKLVIAEKPSVAQSLAKALGVKKRHDGYLEGNGYLASWCLGHLVELSEPEAYDERYEKWRYEDLPILPKEWKYEVSPGTRKQFDILKTLMNRDDVTDVINGCDAGQCGGVAKGNSLQQGLYYSTIGVEIILLLSQGEMTSFFT